MIDLLWGESPHRKAYHPTKWSDTPQDTVFGVFTLDFDSYERYQDFDTGVLHRIWSRIYLAEWFGLGSHFAKMLVLAVFPNMRCPFFEEH